MDNIKTPAFVRVTLSACATALFLAEQRMHRELGRPARGVMK